ncbi:hypothetical protein [Phreatobacter sp.]|uniref:hypothetical protein n=1 Tax=Phreatobacter sp. TaxID=1966341 RepID=UPI003F6EA4CD
MIGLAAAADGVRPVHLAAALAALVALLGVSTWLHADIEAVLRTGPCAGLDCVRPQRPDARMAGYGVEDFRTFVATLGPNRRPALWGLVLDLPVIAAVAGALFAAAALASGGAAFLTERSRAMLLTLPLAYAGIDLAENALLALAYLDAADVSRIVPWASALKFALIAASAAASLMVTFVRWAV